MGQKSSRDRRDSKEQKEQIEEFTIKKQLSAKAIEGKKLFHKALSTDQFPSNEEYKDAIGEEVSYDEDDEDEEEEDEFEAEEEENESTNVKTHKQKLAGIGTNVLSSSFHASNSSKIQQFCKKTSHNTCADCCGGDKPNWCVLNFGCFVCNECAGVHRSFPISIHGGVRSLTLDDWTDEMVNKVEEFGGNEKINSILEYHVPSTIKKPRSGISTSDSRKQYIEEKYIKKSFVFREGRLKKEPQVAVGKFEGKVSFLDGKQTMVGVIDVTILGVDLEISRLFPGSVRLTGGYMLRVKLGRFIQDTIGSHSGRKWLGNVLHLSWDGSSDLEFSILSGVKKKYLAGATFSLNDFKNNIGSRSVEGEVKFQHLKSHNESVLKIPLIDKPETFSYVRFKLDFVDLRA